MHRHFSALTELRVCSWVARREPGTNMIVLRAIGYSNDPQAALYGACAGRILSAGLVKAKKTHPERK